MDEQTKRAVASAIIHTNNLNNCTVGVSLRRERRLLMLTGLAGFILFGCTAVLLR